MTENPARALLVVDVQNDFCEGGSLAVGGGTAVAAHISEHLHAHRGDYAITVASRDYHDPDGDNAGHFGAPPDFRASWPVHCVAGTPGADYHPLLATELIDVEVRKGMGAPAYSMFEGRTGDGRALAGVLRSAGVAQVDVCGLATDYCVRQTALDALAAGFGVRLLTGLCAGVAKTSSDAAVAELARAGAVVDPAAPGGDPPGTGRTSGPEAAQP